MQVNVEKMLLLILIEAFSATFKSDDASYITGETIIAAGGTNSRL
jgi:hypothetical protein